MLRTFHEPSVNHIIAWKLKASSSPDVTTADDYELDRWISLKAAASDEGFSARGLCGAEPHGRWSLGSEVIFRFHCVVNDQDRLTFQTIVSAVFSGDGEGQTLTFTVGRKKLHEEVVRGAACPQLISFDIPAGTFRGDALVEIIVTVGAPIAPRELGVSEDLRLLGVSFAYCRLSSLATGRHLTNHEAVPLSEGRKDVSKFLDAGWHKNDVVTWSKDSVASICFPIISNFSDGIEIDLSFTVFDGVLDSFGDQTMIISVNGISDSILAFEASDRRTVTHRLQLTPFGDGPSGFALVFFHFPNRISPSDTAISEDERALGFGIVDFHVAPTDGEEPSASPGQLSFDDPAFDSGWHESEGNGRWTALPWARVRLGVASRETRSLLVGGTFQHLGIGSKQPSPPIVLSSEDNVVVTSPFGDNEYRFLEVMQFTGKSSSLSRSIWIHNREGFRPAEISLNDDSRDLYAFVEQLFYFDLFAEVEPGETTLFDKAGMVSSTASGWHDAEAWGRWTIGGEGALVAFMLPGIMFGPVRIEINAIKFDPVGAGRPIAFEIAGVRHEIELANEETKLIFTVGANALLQRRVVPIKLTAPNLGTPDDYGATGDGRILGVGIKSVTISTS